MSSVKTVVLIGAPATGKTALVRRMCIRRARFVKECHHTIGVGVYPTTYKRDGESEEVRVQFRDVGGLAIVDYADALYRADVVLLVYSVTDAASFEHISAYHEIAVKTCRGVNYGKALPKFVIVGTHSEAKDCDWKVIPDMVKNSDFLKGVDAMHYTVSSKKCEGFRALLPHILDLLV